jgi:hypothetical protein
LVKSKAKSVGPIDLTEDQPASPIKASPQKPPAKSVGPTARSKPASPRKTPIKEAAPAVTPIKRPGAMRKTVLDDEAAPSEPVRLDPPTSPAVAASPSVAKKFK